MVIARPSRSRVRWAIIGLTCVVSFVAYVLRINMSVAGEAMATDLGLSRVQLGMVLGAFAWGYAALQFPGGLLGDLIGARRALTLLIGLWGLLNLLPGLAPGASLLSPASFVVLLVVLRFLMGAAQAPLYPILGGDTVPRWFPVSAWGLPNAWMNAGAAVGSAAAGPLIGWLVLTGGWRASFLLAAPAALAAAGAWWWYYRDEPATHPGVSADELAYIASDPGRMAPAQRAPGEWRLVLANRDVLLLALSYFCSGYLFYFFFNWLIIYLIEDRRFTLLQGGWFAAAPWITGAIGALAGGALSDRLSRRFGLDTGCRWPAAIALTLAGGLIFVVARSPDPLVAVALLSLCLGFQQASDPIYWAATVAVARRQSATACGVLNTAGNVCGGVGALLVPVTVDALGWPAALATAAGFAFLGAALWLLVRVEHPA